MIEKRTSKLLLLTNNFVGFPSFDQHLLADIECSLGPEAATENSTPLARVAATQQKRLLRPGKLAGSTPNSFRYQIP